jgi:N-methylhydantoinase B
VVLNYTQAYANFAIKAAIAPEVPHNDGAFRPVHITAPRGSILNCVEPAAVASRHLVGHFIPGAIFAALASAAPERLMAGGSEPVWITVWRGHRAAGEESDKSGTPFLLSHFQLGGAGARPAKDGLSATGFPSGVGGVPVEAIESLAPMLQTHRTLRQDSGGAGKFRGGLGQSTGMRCLTGLPWELSAMIDRLEYPGTGLQGGQAGACGRFRVDGERRLAKCLLALTPDASVTLDLPGGGGYGNPFERDPELVLQDVVYGYISSEAAEREYGVAIRYTGAPSALVRMPERYELDADRTRRLRGSVSPII